MFRAVNQLQTLYINIALPDTLTLLWNAANKNIRNISCVKCIYNSEILKLCKILSRSQDTAPAKSRAKLQN